MEKMTKSKAPNFMLLDDGTILNTKDICFVTRTNNDDIVIRMMHDKNVFISEHDYQVLVKKLIITE